jgi:hypothetical protein
MNKFMGGFTIAFLIATGFGFFLYALAILACIARPFNQWSDALGILCALICWGAAYLQHVENVEREEREFRLGLAFMRNQFTRK